MTPDVYLAIKYRDDHANRSVVEGIARALARHDLTTYCVAADLERWGQHQLPPRELMRVALAMIDSARAVLIELSEKGVGLGIEAGYAHARGIPVIVAHPPSSEISATLAGIATAVCTYDDESVAHVAATVAAHLR